MGHRKILFFAVSLIAMATSVARAADLDGFYGDAPPPEAETKVEFGSGWYIRGDIGASRSPGVVAGDEPYDSSLYQATPATAGTAAVPASTTTTIVNGVPVVTTTAGTTATPGTAARYYPRGIFEGPGQTPPGLMSSPSKSLNYTGSLAAGYQFNRWFRADLMFDFHQPLQSSTQGQGRECITGTAGVGATPYQYEIPYTTTCTPTLKASLKSYDVLVNGYFDLGTWHSVTPYIGAGIGMSFGHAQSSSKYVQGNNAAYNVSYTDAINGATYNQYWDRSDSKQYYNLAYALMGGFAIDVYDHTKLDIGYRYIDLGSVLGTKLYTQEVRAGLRYMIDN